jgi:glycosyltransferase involved in cell wall biosynthesis
MSPTTHGATLHRSKQCIEFIDQLDFDLDVVHTHFATPKTFSARYVSAYYDVPCTVTTHAHDLYDDPDQVQVAQMLGAFDHIVTISEYNRQYIRKHLTDDSPISVVHAGVRPTKFEPGAHGGPPRILTVCRFVEKKGVPYGLDAVAKIVDQFPELEYHLIGSGPMANEIRTQIIEHGLSNTVELLSNVDDDRLRTEYAEASCVLLPAIIAESGDRDGIPVVLMEAMATETPPISTTVSGIPELIDNRESGLLVTPRDVAALADALALLLADPELQQEFGRAGRGKIRRAFDIRTEVAKLEGIFSAVVASSS